MSNENPFSTEDHASLVPDPPIKGGFGETVEIPNIDVELPVMDPPIKGS